MCAFKIKLELFDVSEETGEAVTIERTPGKYITKDQDYVDAVIPVTGIERFYYPIVPQEAGDLLIFTNMTAPLGQNGPVMILLNINSNCSKPYPDWDYAWPFSGYFIEADSSLEGSQP